MEPTEGPQVDAFNDIFSFLGVHFRTEMDAFKAMTNFFSVSSTMKLLRAEPYMELRDFLSHDMPHRLVPNCFTPVDHPHELMHRTDCSLIQQILRQEACRWKFTLFTEYKQELLAAGARFEFEKAEIAYQKSLQHSQTDDIEMRNAHSFDP